MNRRRGIIVLILAIVLAIGIGMGVWLVLFAGRPALQQVRKPDPEAEALLETLWVRQGKAPKDNPLLGEKAAGIQRARYLLRIGQPQECITYCNDWMKKNPGPAKANILPVLAGAYLLQGDAKSAAEALKEGITAVPTSPT